MKLLQTLTGKDFSSRQLRPFLIRVIAASLMFLGLFFLGFSSSAAVREAIEQITTALTANVQTAEALETMAALFAGKIR